jgi:hypothetical protein
MRSRKCGGVLVLSLLIAASCDDEHHDDADGHHDESLDAGPARTAAQIACDHFEFGPAVDLAAAAEGAALPAVEPHTRSNLRLAAVQGGNGGRLTFEPGQEGTVFFFLDGAVPLTVLDAAQAEVALRSTAVEMCAPAAAGFEVELDDAPYVLVLGPSEAGEVALVVHVPPAEGEHHDEHGDVEVPDEYADLANPLGDDPAAVSAGRDLYRAQCASCHGEGGKGDGPAARSQEPAPTDLTGAESREQTDGYLFWRLTEGRNAAENPSTMPAFGGLLSEEESWQVISFLRTLGG